jgi:AcrR family transcriptional regulator
MDRPRLSDDVILGFRRIRLTDAMAAACAANGYAATTVDEIVTLAQSSRATFYDSYPNTQALFVDLLERGFGEATELTEVACAETVDPEQRVKRGLTAALGWIDENRAIAHACLIDAPTAGSRALQLQLEGFDRFATLLSENAPADSSRPPATAGLLIDGVVSILRFALIGGRRTLMPEPLDSLALFLQMLFQTE